MRAARDRQIRSTAALAVVAALAVSGVVRGVDAVAYTLHAAYVNSGSTVDWSTPTLWQPNGVPGTSAADTVTLGPCSTCLTVTIGADVALSTLRIIPGVPALQLVFSGSSALSVVNALEWTGGHLTGAGRLIIESGCTWDAIDLNQNRAIRNGFAVWNRGLVRTGASGPTYVARFDNAVWYNNGTFQCTSSCQFPYYASVPDPQNKFINSGVVQTLASNTLIFTVAMYNALGGSIVAAPNSGVLFNAGGENRGLMSHGLNARHESAAPYIYYESGTYTGAGYFELHTGSVPDIRAAGVWDPIAATCSQAVPFTLDFRVSGYLQDAYITLGSSVAPGTTACIEFPVLMMGKAGGGSPNLNVADGVVALFTSVQAYTNGIRGPGTVYVRSAFVRLSGGTFTVTGGTLVWGPACTTTMLQTVDVPSGQTPAGRLVNYGTVLLEHDGANLADGARATSYLTNYGTITRSADTGATVAIGLTVQNYGLIHVLADTLAMWSTVNRGRIVVEPGAQLRITQVGAAGSPATFTNAPDGLIVNRGIIEVDEGGGGSQFAWDMANYTSPAAASTWSTSRALPQFGLSGVPCVDIGNVTLELKGPTGYALRLYNSDPAAPPLTAVCTTLVTGALNLRLDAVALYAVNALWDYGTLHGTGGVLNTLGPVSMPLVASGQGSRKFADTVQWNNYGAVAYTGRDVDWVSGAVTVRHYGTWLIATPLAPLSWAVLSGTHALINYGVIQKVVVGDAAHVNNRVDVPVTNHGVFELGAYWEFRGVFTQTMPTARFSLLTSASYFYCTTLCVPFTIAGGVLSGRGTVQASSTVLSGTAALWPSVDFNLTSGAATLFPASNALTFTGALAAASTTRYHVLVAGTTAGQYSSAVVSGSYAVTSILSMGVVVAASAGDAYTVFTRPASASQFASVEGCDGALFTASYGAMTVVVRAAAVGPQNPLIVDGRVGVNMQCCGVPSAPCATLQYGIDRALSGRTVLVRNGTYTGAGNNDVSLRGKAIALVAESGPELTRIEVADGAAAFVLSGGEAANSTIRGFTIAPVSGSTTSVGIRITASSTTLVGLRFDGLNGAVSVASACTASSACTAATPLTALSSPALHNCTFTGGRGVPVWGSGGGGAVTIADAVVRVDNCTFFNHSATYAGALLATGVTRLTLWQVVFDHNRAVSDAAAYGHGGALVVDGVVSVVASYVSFRSNVATRSGGAMTLAGVMGSALFAHCTWTDNAAAQVYGGAAHITGSQNVTLLDGVMSGNRVLLSTSNGGAIAVLTSLALSLEGMQLVNNTAGAYGGGAYLSSSSAVLHNCQVQDNALTSSSVSSGGGGLAAFESTVRVSDSLWHRNSAVAAGLGLYASSSTLSLTRVQVFDHGNSDGGVAFASATGGGLYASSSNVELTDCEFRALSAKSGGALYAALNSAVSATNTEFVANRASTLGGSLYVVLSALTLVGCAVRDSTAAVNGGALSVSSATALLSVSDTLLVGNNASAAGAVYVFQSDVALTRVQLIGNRALAPAVGAAGALYVLSAASVTLTDVYAERNAAVTTGAVLYALTCTTVTLTNVTVVGSSAVDGAGLYALNSQTVTGAVACRRCSSLTLLAAQFVRNRATTRGGAMDVDSCPAMHTGGSVFIANTASTIGGGALYALDSQWTSAGDVFTANVAAFGGAVYFAESTGAVGGFGSPLASLSMVTFASNNASAGGGGGLYWSTLLPPAVTLAAVPQDNSAVFGPVLASSPKRVHVVRDAVTNATGAMSGETSGNSILVHVQYRASVVDHYNTTVPLNALNPAIIAVATTDPLATTLGRSSVATASGEALFTSFGVLGTPGTTLELRFSASGLVSGTSTLSLRPCGGGEQRQGQLCVPCAIGYFSNGTGVCYPCAAGTRGDQFAGCVPCSVGTASSASAATDCVACRKGTIANQTGQQQCQTCSAGQYSQLVGSSACSACEPGSYSQSGQETCTECSAFSFTPLTGATACLPCPPFSVTFDRRYCRCNAGYYASQYTTNYTAEQLVLNLDLRVDVAQCSVCPGGADCRSSGTVVLDALPGWWQSEIDQTRFYPCRGGVDGITTTCTGGSRIRSAAVGSVGVCDTGSTGPLCAICHDGYYVSTNGKCAACGDGGVDPKVIFWLAVAFLIALMVVVWAILARLSVSATNSYTLSGSSVPQMQAASEADPSQKIKTVAGFFQIATKTSPAFSITWPPVIAGMFAVFAVINIDLTQLASVSCAIGTDFYDNYLIVLTFPAVVTAALLVGYVVDALALGYIPCCAALFGQTSTAAAPSDAPASSPKSSAAARRTRLWSALRTKFVKCFLIVVFLLYPNVSASVLALFKCSEVDGAWYLEADYRVSCYDARWNRYAVAGAVGLVVFVAGVPLSTLFLLWRHRAAARLDRPDVRDRWGFLYAAYKPQFWWFEVAELLRKLLLTSVIVFISQGSPAQLLVAILITLAFMMLAQETQPFLVSSDYNLHVLSQLQILLLFLLALMIRVTILQSQVNGEDSTARGLTTDSNTSAGYDVRVFTAALLLIVVALLAVFAYQMMHLSRRVRNFCRSLVGRATCCGCCHTHCPACASFCPQPDPHAAGAHKDDVSTTDVQRFGPPAASSAHAALLPVAEPSDVAVVRAGHARATSRADSRYAAAGAAPASVVTSAEVELSPPAVRTSAFVVDPATAAASSAANAPFRVPDTPGGSSFADFKQSTATAPAASATTANVSVAIGPASAPAPPAPSAAGGLPGAPGTPTA